MAASWEGENRGVVHEKSLLLEDYGTSSGCGNKALDTERCAEKADKVTTIDDLRATLDTARCVEKS